MPLVGISQTDPSDILLNVLTIDWESIYDTHERQFPLWSGIPYFLNFLAVPPDEWQNIANEAATFYEAINAEGKWSRRLPWP